MKSLLARGVDVNARELRQGQTALMWAVARKHPAVAQALIEHGADVHARSKSGFTPMLFAARVGDVDSARALLAAGVNVNEKTPVNAAPPQAAYGNPDDDTGSLEAPESAMTPLLMASASGHEALSIFLLENGADPDAWDGRAAPLHYAVMKGISDTHFRPNMPELVKALVAHGANPNVRLVSSPLSGLGRGGAGATPFLLAAATFDTNVMRILLAAGADPLLKTRANVTALMLAAGLLREDSLKPDEQGNAMEAVKLTLELGCDVNAVNDTGRTALHGAANLSSDAIIQFLVDNGAKLDVKDKYQQTPLSIAMGIHLPWVPKGQELGEEGFVVKSTADLLLKLGATPVTTPGYFTPVEEDSSASRFNPRQPVVIPGVK